MGIGACVALIAIGAVLTFATEFDIAGMDVNAVGVILMIAGALGLLVTMQIFRPRSRREPAPREAYPPHAGHYPPQAPGPYGQQPPGQYPQQPPPGPGGYYR
ncbi:MAG: DUF6458 family protein [Actinomycetes bacterium]